MNVEIRGSYLITEGEKKQRSSIQLTAHFSDQLQVPVGPVYKIIKTVPQLKMCATCTLAVDINMNVSC